eukprot:586681-Rhodomonas_salina.1
MPSTAPLPDQLAAAGTRERLSGGMCGVMCGGIDEGGMRGVGVLKPGADVTHVLLPDNRCLPGQSTLSSSAAQLRETPRQLTCGLRVQSSVGSGFSTPE